MSVNPPEGTLTIENSHLDVKGNVSAVALKLGTLRLTPSYGLDAVANVSNSTTHTLELSNATTGLVTTSNLVVGGGLTVGGTSLVDLIYPLGAIYITTSAVSPSSIWAGTTWVAYGEGRTMIGHGAGAGLTDRPTVEATGGAETHTLTKAEIPPHTHSEVRHNDHKTTSVTHPGLNIYDATGYQTVDTGDGSVDVAGNAQLLGQSHNNMQPYIVTYMWKRTA